MSDLYGAKEFVSIVEEVGQWVYEQTPSDTNFTNPTFTWVKQIVNDCHREVLSEHPWLFLFGTSSFSTVAAQITPYAISDSAIDVLWMVIENYQRYLIRREMEDFRKEFPWMYTNQGLQVPVWYIPGPVADGTGTASKNGTQFYLFPGPDNVYTITFGFKIRVQDMVQPNDVMNIPPEWQDVVISKAIYYCFHKRNDTRAAEWKTRYEERFRKMWLWNEQKTMEYKRDSGGGAATRLIMPYLDR